MVGNVRKKEWLPLRENKFDDMQSKAVFREYRQTDRQTDAITVTYKFISVCSSFCSVNGHQSLTDDKATNVSRLESRDII